MKDTPEQKCQRPSVFPMPNNGGRVGRFETLESYPDESGWRQLCFVLGWAAWMAGAVYVIYMVGGIAWHTLAEIAKVLK